jgi:hypothetical protein
LLLLQTACSPVQQAASSSAPPAASPSPTAGTADPPAATPQPVSIPPGSVVLACTPIEDHQYPAGQVGVAQPFSLLLDRNDHPLGFLGALPVRIPFKVEKIEQATAAPPQLRVGAVIHYAANDAEHQMYTALAVMKDGTYRLEIVLKTPQQPTLVPADAGHGTCVSKPA